MLRPTLSLLLLSSVSATVLQAQQTISLTSVEAYGTIHAGGVVVVVSGDGDWDATAGLEWRQIGDSAYRSGFPLTRIDGSHFVGSLLWLEADTGYEVRVTLADPDGVTGSASATTSFTTRSDTLGEPASRTIYVANGGNDGNAGTDPAYPLASIQQAADLAAPGDLILIAAGTYRESVLVSTSGTAEQPIVFRGVGSATIVDGSDEAIAAGVSWTAGANGVYSRTLGFATGHVVTDLGRLFRYDSLSELVTLGAGGPGGFHFDGTTLHLKLSGGGSPAARQVYVARLEDGFYLDGCSHVRIEQLSLRYFGSGDYGKGVYLRYASDSAVRHCLIHEVGSAAVWIKGGERNLVEHNQIWDSSIFDWIWSYTKGSSAENNAVVLTNEIGRGNVIRCNTISGTFNGIGPCGSSAPPSGFSVETDVYANQLSQLADDAFEPEGYCSNVRLWGNTIEDAHMAFAVAPAAPGPTYIVRNIAYNTGNNRTSQIDGWTASALKINSGYSTPVGPLYLLHNTFVTEAPQTDAVALLNPGYSTFIQARNNIFAGTRYVLSKVNPVTLDWDSDLLYTSDPGRFVYWEGSQYTTIGALTAATGQEPSGLTAAPDLLDPSAGDFTPAATSPLVDRGVPLAGINDGYAGAAPDIGAVERSWLFADDFESGDTSAWTVTIQ
jgi:hypothetical protein